MVIKVNGKYYITKNNYYLEEKDVAYKSKFNLEDQCLHRYRKEFRFYGEDVSDEEKLGLGEVGINSCGYTQLI